MTNDNHHFSVFRVTARGLEEQRRALGAATENMANAQTTRTEDGEPYGIKRTVHEMPDGGRHQRFSRLLNAKQGAMQRADTRHMDGPSLRRKLPEQNLGPVTEIEEIQNERLEFDPSHPHADEDGYVRYPDINVLEEMTRMMSANRIYEANLTALEAAKETIKRTLEI